MSNVNYNGNGVGSFGTKTSLCIGIVKNNADPAQHGRLQIWIPSIDSVTVETDDLPWANYVSPYGGVTADFLVGREQDEVPGGTAYGFWAIPKNGAQVLVGFLEGDPMVRFWMGCFYIPELNRTLPQSVNGPEGPASELDDSGQYPQQVIPHMQENLEEAGLDVGSKHYKTRGGFERSVSHPSNKNRDKPRDDGYATNPLDPEKADSQVVSLTTPGRHYIAMSDVDEHCRIRLKTTAGHQIIFDDTNERIYISTAEGKNWVELDENGKIYVYSASKINIHSDNDINLSSNENINIVARKRINLVSEERGIKLQSSMGLQFLSSGGDIKITASRSVHVKTTGGGNAGGVGESSSCTVGGYEGDPLGLTRDYAEESGSGESSVFINAANNIEEKADGGGIHLNASASIDVLSGSSVNLDAGGTLNLVGNGGIATAGPGVLGMYAGEVDQAPVYSYFDASGAGGASGGTAVSGEDVKGKMIVPKHESWERDEDEAECKTPRNKKYQG